ncbi:MAG: 2-hydroxyacyl-CoA dehydratase [Desulfomonilia bacterium]
MTVKDKIDKARSVIMGIPTLMKSFSRNSLAGYIIEAKSLNDALIYTKYWALIWAAILKLILKLFFKKGPIVLIRQLIHYPWMFILLRATGLLRRLSRGRKGAYLESTGLIILGITLTIAELMEDIFYHSERLIVSADLITPEIAFAMGLKTWQLEDFGIVLPFLYPEAALKYIDEAENAGINPDACSFVKKAMGMILKGHMPKGVAIVGSNMPCDAGMASYTFTEQKFGVPTYRVDAPAHFYNERAEKLFVDDLKGMIAFLEKHTPGRMDWDRFRKICEGRNRMMELELELWDMIRAKPAPLAGEAVWLSHMWFFYVFPGHKISIRLFERLVELARKNLSAKIPAVENEKYRAVLWNPPFPHFVDIMNLMERTYGLTLIMDSMTYNRHTLIDTSTPESMLKGLAQVMLQGPMVRHTRGPAENYLDDIFRIYNQFDLDMVWVANHVGCKSAGAMNGILREKCREKNIPLLILDYDLLDPRIVSHEGMVRQVDHFMENVMKARRIDQ